MNRLVLALILATQTIQAQEYSRNLPPVLLTKCTPRYTEEARRMKIEGIVTLSVEIHPDGHAHSIKVEQSLGMGLDESAADALTQWRFKPGEKHGEPVITTATIQVHFQLLSDNPSKACAVVSRDEAGKPN